MFAGDPITRKTDRALSKGVDMVVLLSRGKNKGCHREGGKNCGSGQGRFYFCTRTY